MLFTVIWRQTYGYDHSDSEKGNLLPPHRLLFTINSNGSFILHHPTDRIAHTTAFVTPVVEHWLEREIAQWVHHMKDWSDDPLHHEWTPLPQSYISLPTDVPVPTHSKLKWCMCYHLCCWMSMKVSSPWHGWCGISLLLSVLHNHNV